MAIEQKTGDNVVCVAGLKLWAPNKPARYEGTYVAPMSPLHSCGGSLYCALALENGTINPPYLFSTPEAAEMKHVEEIQASLRRCYENIEYYQSKLNG